MTLVGYCYVIASVDEDCKSIIIVDVEVAKAQVDRSRIEEISTTHTQTGEKLECTLRQLTEGVVSGKKRR